MREPKTIPTRIHLANVWIIPCSGLDSLQSL